MNRAQAVIALASILAAPCLAQPGPDQVACWTTAGVSTYDLVGTPKVEGGTLSYKSESQDGLALRQSGACIARQEGAVPATPGGQSPIAQCYDPNGSIVYSQEVYYPYPVDGALVWIEVQTGDFIIALAAMRCDVLVFE